MAKQIRSGREIVDDFFNNNISDLEDVDKNIIEMLTNLYKQGKLTETNVKNELERLRENDVCED